MRDVPNIAPTLPSGHVLHNKIVYRFYKAQPICLKENRVIVAKYDYLLSVNS